MTGPLLSVCIATMNRADYLRGTLENIAAQATDDMQVVVVDGGSTDATSAVVRSFSARLNLLYHQQSAPGGVDKDFDTAVTLASGDYCWLMSDDDALAPGAVARVLQQLADRTLGLVVVNASICNADFSQVLTHRFVEVTADRRYGVGDDEQLFIDTGNFLTFIGCVVVRRAIWLARQRQPYYGSLFVHVGVLFQAPLPNPSLLLSDPLIAIRYGNAQWSARAFEIWMFKWPTLVWSFRFSDGAKGTVCRPYPWTRSRALLLHRAKGSYTLNQYRQWLAARMPSRAQRAVAIAIAVTPITVANVMVSAALKVLYPQPGVALMDLRASRYNSFASARRLMNRLRRSFLSS